MVVAVNVACMRAIAAHSERAANRGLCRALGTPPCRIPAESAHRRPVRHRWRRRGFIVLSKLAGGVDYLPADDGQIGCRVRDLVFRTGEVITIRNDQICELTDLDASLLALVAGEPRHVLGPHAQRSLAIEAIALRVEPHSGNGPAGDEPSERNPRIVGSNAGSVSPTGDFHSAC